MEDKKVAISMAGFAYLSANKATSAENLAQMQIVCPENVQFSFE